MDGVVAGEAWRGSGPRIRGCRRRADTLGRAGRTGGAAGSWCVYTTRIRAVSPSCVRVAGATQCEKLAVKREKVVDIHLSGAIIYGLQKCSKGIRSAAKDSWHRKV